MKTKNLFLSCILTFLAFFSVNGQNTVLTTSQVTPGPGSENVLVGSGAGLAVTTGQQNVYVGINSGRSNTGVTNNNTFLGYRTGQFAVSGGSNVYVGSSSGLYFASGSANTFVGTSAGVGINPATNGGVGSTGTYNSFFGGLSGYLNSSGNRNVFLGYDSGYSNDTGAYNTFSGVDSGLNCNTGNFNTFMGYESGKGITSGSNNTILGRPGVLPNISNTIILADGSNVQRFYIHSNGFAGVGLANNVIPSNTFEIKALTGSPTQSGFTASGLRLTSLPNTNFNTTPPTSSRRVLTVNGNGDVILVDDIGGGINASCSTAGFVPVNSATANTLACSQIYDDGTSVGIGTGAQPSTYFNYTYAAGDDAIGYVPLSGTAKLKVNGVTWSGGFYASSDRKFKKDIKPIESALKTVQSIEGKTYKWNKESNKEMDFDGGNHSGFIAQELEKILPHLVATDEKGNKAVNYMELMPYLVEAIKEQQIQINDLKNQLAENFKAQNQDLIELTNTKIINVSPNPSNDMITVSFNVEKSVQSAKLQVYDLNGTIISSLTINDRENNITRTLQKDNFGKGIYVVSLLVNGKSIDTKKIVFN